MAEQDVQKVAEFVCNIKDWNGDARLYHLHPEYKNTGWDIDGEAVTIIVKHVIVSAVVVPYSGEETYIFKCNKNGKDVQYTELPGSFKGSLNHEAALEGMGYTITNDIYQEK